MKDFYIARKIEAKAINGQIYKHNRQKKDIQFPDREHIAIKRDEIENIDWIIIKEHR